MRLELTMRQLCCCCCCCCCLLAQLAGLAAGAQSPAPSKEMFANFLWEHKLALTDNQTMSESKFHELLESLSLGRQRNASCPTATTADDAHVHDRRRRRSVDEFEPVEQCLSGEAMAAAFGFNLTAGGLTKVQFVDMAIALVQQLAGKFCIAGDSGNSTSASQNLGLTYLYSSLAVLVISLLSTVGCVLGICYKSRHFDRLILFFVELAVGSLVGESALHLLPALVEGSHSHGGMPDYFPKLLVFCLVLCLLHAVDTFSMANNFESGHAHHHQVASTQMNHIAEHHEHKDHEHQHEQQHEQQLEQQQQSPEEGKEAPKETDTRMVHPHVPLIDMLRRPKLWLREPYRLCLFVLVSDALHNFADGLAVGAAFVLGHSDGLRLSLTVALHELAHELADFAILLSCGFSVGAAVLLNFISALTAFIGLYVAIPLAHVSAELKLWILAFAAAMFIYIALVTMMNAVRQGCTNGGMIAFVIGNAGLLAGFVCVIAISMYEFYG